MCLEFIFPLVHQGELNRGKGQTVDLQLSRLKAPPNQMSSLTSRADQGSDLCCGLVNTAHWDLTTVRCKDPRPHAETTWHRMCRGQRRAGQWPSQAEQYAPTPNPILKKLTGISRRAWFSAFGLPFFFPSVLSLAGFPGSKQSEAWFGTVCPLCTTGIPTAQETTKFSGCITPATPKGPQALTESWLTHTKAQGL